MSRPSQLPPRCPFQRKSIPRATHEPNPCSPAKANPSLTRHHKSLSQGSTLDDHPSWLDDLLSDSEDSSPSGIFHSRSSSDSASLFDRFVPNIKLSLSKNEEHSLESSCIYGPNSPRKKSNVDLSDSSLLMALSDYASQSSVPYVEDVSQGSRTREDYGSLDDFNCDPNSGKRHPGQRSRARKLQYIAELERTVNVLQTMESELAIRISTLRQQKLLLSMENSNLKQQMARMQQQKLLMDGEYESMRKEVERLKLGLASSFDSKFRAYDSSNENEDIQTCWSNLDWKKLHL